MKKFQLALTMLAALASPAWPASQTVTLSLPTMDCPVCPITVKKALGKVPGVSDAKVNFDKREATVLRMRFGLNDEQPKTLKEIGESLGLTRERVRQIENETLGKLSATFAAD